MALKYVFMVIIAIGIILLFTGLIDYEFIPIPEALKGKKFIDPDGNGKMSLWQVIYYLAEPLRALGIELPWKLTPWIWSNIKGALDWITTKIADLIYWIGDAIVSWIYGLMGVEGSAPPGVIYAAGAGAVVGGSVLITTIVKRVI